MGVLDFNLLLCSEKYFEELKLVIKSISDLEENVMREKVKRIESDNTTEFNSSFDKIKDIKKGFDKIPEINTYNFTLKRNKKQNKGLKLGTYTYKRNKNK